jgi:hypothetical protein
MSPVALPWEDFLPALEEWTRRTGALLRGEGDTRDVVAEPVPLAVVPSGPLPPALAGRAAAAHAELSRLESVGAARRAALHRTRAYATA